MKSNSTPAKQYRQTPPPSREQIAALAAQVELGQVVTADLNDGTFRALMLELHQRGYTPISRSASDRHLHPSRIVVRRNS